LVITIAPSTNKISLGTGYQYVRVSDVNGSSGYPLLSFCFPVNSRVLRSAISRGFKAPTPGTYFLADGGYGGFDGLLLIPYQRVRYYLKEWDHVGRKVQNAKELFNLRHSSLRTVVERVFGVMKWRFQVLRNGQRGFSIRSEVKIVYACIALHNWLNRNGGEFEKEAAEAEAAGLLVSSSTDVIPEGARCDERRDEIANFM